MAAINLIVEGDLDEAVAGRIVRTVGHEIGVCYGKRGYGYIQSKIAGFNMAARNVHYLALVDFMDTRLSCPAEVVAQWVPNRQQNMLFRVVVREIESWLLADRINLARFLRISPAHVPASSEQINDPKLTLVNLARHSKNSRVRAALIPEVGSTAQVGRLYTSEMKVFISESWDVDAARRNSPSLNKCMIRLEELTD